MTMLPSDPYTKQCKRFRSCPTTVVVDSAWIDRQPRQRLPMRLGQCGGGLALPVLWRDGGWLMDLRNVERCSNGIRHCFLVQPFILQPSLTPSLSINCTVYWESIL